jgi:hypothetical protein
VHAVPVSRFTRLQESPADTSNECSDFTQYRGQTEEYATAKAREHAEKSLIGRAFRRSPATNPGSRNPALRQSNRVAYSSWKEHLVLPVIT